MLKLGLDRLVLLHQTQIGQSTTELLAHALQPDNMLYMQYLTPILLQIPILIYAPTNTNTYICVPFDHRAFCHSAITPMPDNMLHNPHAKSFNLYNNIHLYLLSPPSITRSAGG